MMIRNNNTLNRWKLGRSISLLFGLFVMLSCTDVDNRADRSERDWVNVRLELPDTHATTGGVDSEIADLRVIDFCSDGNVYNWVLYDKALSGNDLTEIGMGLPVGTHTLYFIANGGANQALLERNGEAFSLADVTTKEQLDKLLIAYAGTLEKGTLHIPLLMTYKVETTWENDQMGKTIELPVPLEHTCVKVSYTVRFDNSSPDTKEELKGKRFKLHSVSFKNLASKSSLLTSAPFAGTPVNAAFEEIASDLFDYDSWIYSGVAYIPEYIYEEATTYSYLEIVGSVTGSQIHSTYRIQLTGTASDLTTLVTPRGTEYSIDGSITGLGERDGIEVAVRVADWVPEDVSVSAGEYRLDVSKTTFEITSNRSDTLYYTSNAPDIRFSIDSPLCAIEEAAGNTQEKGMIILKAKSNFDSSTSGGVGTAVLSAMLFSADTDGIAVLTKKMAVSYDLQPFLKVNPTLLVLNWEGKSGTTLSENVLYETNLPTVTVNPVSLPAGHTIGTPHDGKITVTAPKVDRTVEYAFEVIATDQRTTLRDLVKVIVKPDLSGIYRIHFRVINDVKNPVDMTDLKRWGNCCVDVYNETNSHVSRFCGAWPGKPMNYANDEENRGWFVYDLAVDATPNAGGGSKPIDSSAKIEPGISLIMFTYDQGGNSDYKYQVQQRYPGHKEPGVPLFNFDDHEGWFVYDPTSAAGSLQFYDEEPSILDLTYTVHWETAVPYPNMYLYRDYGSTNDVVSGMPGAKAHRIRYEKEMMVEGSNWSVGSLALQSLADNRGKELKCSFKNGGSDIHQLGVIFNGRNWTEGWFKNPTWYSSKP